MGHVEEFLWLLGFYVAQGSLINNELVFKGEAEELAKVMELMEIIFEYKPEIDEEGYISIESKILVDLIGYGLNFGRKEKDIPNWILQLPPGQLIMFLTVTSEILKMGQGVQKNVVFLLLK